jgi:hypothetical protein
MADVPDLAGQGEAADLLKQAKAAVPAPSAAQPAAVGSQAPVLGPGEIEALLKQNAASGAVDEKAFAPGGLQLASAPTASCAASVGEIAPADIDL